MSTCPASLQSHQYPRYQGSPIAHRHLIESGRILLNQMCHDPRILEAAAPTLFHPDLHKRNVFVSEQDPTVVTGIIDWQSESIGPAFWYADHTPDFAKLPSSAGDRDNPYDELCAQAFEGSVSLLMPKLALSRAFDTSLFRPFQYCHRTWKDGVVAFRHELMETVRQRLDLNLSGQCPIPLPPKQVLVTHQEHYQRFLAAQSLKRDLSRLLDYTSDGWLQRRLGMRLW